MIRHRNDDLTKDEEIELGFKIQKMRLIKSRNNYDFFNLNYEEQEIVESGEEALEVLTGNYINLARSIAHKHHKRTGTRYPIEDLLQDAVGALIEAANAYDPSKDCKLGTYAFYGITKKVSTTINYQRLVRMPENKMGEYILITKAQKSYADLSEKEKEEYLNELDYIYKNVEKLSRTEVDLILGNMQPQVSLNAKINEGQGELMDVIVDEKSEIQLEMKEYLDEDVEKIINQLTPFQKDLIAYEFDVYKPSMLYSDFLRKYELTDRVVKRETNKTIRFMINIAKRKKYSWQKATYESR